MTRPGAVDLNAIRERSERCEEYRDDPKDRIDKWALAAVASAADVPALIAAVESLRIQRDNAEQSEDQAHKELARTRAALGHVREHLDLRDSELVSANAQRDHARAALADALQVISDLRGGTS